MRKGSRTVKKTCACGCGGLVPPYLKPNGRVNVYPKYIPNHGPKAWGKRLSEKLRNDPMLHPGAKPIGARRKHNVRGIIYWVIKTSPRGRWKYEHRLVLERKLDRKLLRTEHAHHLNENTLDNRPENIELLKNGAHTAHHANIRSHIRALEERCAT